MFVSASATTVATASATAWRVQHRPHPETSVDQSVPLRVANDNVHALGKYACFCL